MPSIDTGKLKTILGIKPEENKSKIKKKHIGDLINKNKLTIENKIKRDERNQIDPNAIILLKQCGFELEKYSSKNCMGGKSYYYNIVGNDIIFHTNYPIQVFYTNLIIEKLSKDEYFQDNYMEYIYINDKYFKIEESVENINTNYLQKKYLDIAIHSAKNIRHIISIEINEYEHKNKQAEDEKRRQDLVSKKNSQGYTIYGPFVLKLNKNGEVSEEEFNRFINDVLEWIKKVDKINYKDEDKQKQQKEFVIDYMVNKEIGKKVFCEMLYDSYMNKEKYIICANDIIDFFGPSFKKKIKKNIEDEFIQYQHNLDQQIKDEGENKKTNYKMDGDNTMLNFDGFSELMQFLHLHSEYFKTTIGYNKMTVFIQNVLNCMFSAMIDLNNEIQKREDLYKDYMKSRTTSFHYGSYD